MNYTKPEVAVLGEAVRVIELVGGKGNSLPVDNQHKRIDPAYDLDE